MHFQCKEKAKPPSHSTGPTNPQGQIIINTKTYINKPTRCKRDQSQTILTLIMNSTDDSFFDYSLPSINSLSPTTSLPSIPTLSPTALISIQPSIFWQPYTTTTDKTHSKEDITTIEDVNNPNHTPQQTSSMTQLPTETSNKPEPQILSNNQLNSTTTQNITIPENTYKTIFPTNKITDKNHNRRVNAIHKDSQSQKFPTHILKKCKSITDITLKKCKSITHITHKYPFITFHQNNPNGTGHMLCTHCYTGKGNTGKLTYPLNSKETYRKLKNKLKTHFASKTHIYKTIINNPSQEGLSLQQITTPTDPKIPKTELDTNRQQILERNNNHPHQYSYTQSQTNNNPSPQKQTTQLALPITDYYSTRTTYPIHPPNTPVHPPILHTQQTSGDSNLKTTDIPLTKHQVIDNTTLRLDVQRKGRLPRLLHTLAKLDEIEEERASLDQKRKTLTVQWKETYTSIIKITNNFNHN